MLKSTLIYSVLGTITVLSPLAHADFDVTEVDTLICVATNWPEASLQPILKYEAHLNYQPTSDGSDQEIRNMKAAKYSLSVSTYDRELNPTTLSLASTQLPTGSSVDYSAIAYGGIANGKTFSLIVKNSQLSVAFRSSDLNQEDLYTPVGGSMMSAFSVAGTMHISTTKAGVKQRYDGDVRCQGLLTSEGIMGGLSPNVNSF